MVFFAFTLYYENGSFLAVVFNTAGSASPGAELLMKRVALQAEAVGFMEFGAARKWRVQKKKEKKHRKALPTGPRRTNSSSSLPTNAKLSD